MSKRVLVTGGAGFIGSHLVEKLVAEGCSVTVMDNFFTGVRENVHSRCEILRHDVTTPFTFECDEIYHLACPASPVHYQRNPARTIKTAVMGTLHALEAARDCGARILIASTSEVYGDPEVHPQKETYWGNVNPIGPRACYDEGKRCAESLAISYHQQYDVDVRIARIFNTYGPRMQRDDGRVVSNFVVSALTGAPLVLHGGGDQTRSFCFVSDTVAGFQGLMGSEKVGGLPVNIGNPRETTVRELAELVCKLTTTKSQVAEGERLPDDPRRRCPDITMAKDILGWEPKVSLEDGIAATILDFAERLKTGAA